MRPRAMLISLGLLTVLGGCHLPEPATGIAPGSEKRFLLGVEQDGRKIAIQNHQVVLKKSPFAILVVFPVPDAVRVNASFNPQTFQAAQAGQALLTLPAFASKGVPEELFNASKLLVIGDQTGQNWQYYSEKIHRFDEVVNREGAWFCRRTIRKFQTDSAPPADISTIDAPAIYLTFVNTDWTANAASRTERQRDYLKIVFE